MGDTWRGGCPGRYLTPVTMHLHTQGTFKKVEGGEEVRVGVLKYMLNNV